MTGLLIEKKNLYFSKKYESNKAELLIIYGRKRIGKTELIKQFIADKKAIYGHGMKLSNFLICE